MIDATLQQIPADCDQVGRLIQQARNHQQSAARVVDGESAYILLYSAVHKVLAAALLADGYRVGAGERGHVVLIQSVKERLGAEHATTLTRIDRGRRKRNKVAYESEAVSKGELDALSSNVADTFKAVSAYIKERVPKEASS